MKMEMKTMNLIDRYVYAVTERLPEDIRDDVSRELRANIEDMLSGSLRRRRSARSLKNSVIR